jgi:hypothetical protein
MRRATERSASAEGKGNLGGGQGGSSAGPGNTKKPEASDGGDDRRGVHRIVQRNGKAYPAGSDAAWHAWCRRVYNAPEIGMRGTPSKCQDNATVKFLQHQTQESLLALVQTWWEFPKETYGILHTLIMLLEGNDRYSREFMNDLHFLKELLIIRNLMAHNPGI